LLGASSFASARVKALTAPLEALYAASQLAPAIPQTEEMLMIFPHFSCTICGMAKWQQL